MRATFQAIATTTFLIVIFSFSTNASALAISASDQATSCNEIFRCGSNSLGPGQTDDLFGEALVQKSAIEFSLLGLTEISNAKLRLVASSFSPYTDVFINDPVLEIHGYVGDGTIQFSDLNVNNLLLTTPPIATLGAYTFDVTSFVAALVADGAAYAGFSIRDIAPNSAVTFSTSNTLVVNVPEPEQIWLMVAGLIALVIRFRGEKTLQRHATVKS